MLAAAPGGELGLIGLVVLLIMAVLVIGLIIYMIPTGTPENSAAIQCRTGII